MSKIDSVLARIRAYADHEHLKPATLSQRAGLHPNTLRAFWGKDWSPTLETLKKIEALIPEDFEANNPLDALPRPPS